MCPNPSVGAFKVRIAPQRRKIGCLRAPEGATSALASWATESSVKRALGKRERPRPSPSAIIIDHGNGDGFIDPVSLALVKALTRWRH